VESSLANVNLHFVDSVEKANNFITWLSQRRPHDAIAIDIETGEFPGQPKEGALLRGTVTFD